VVRKVTISLPDELLESVDRDAAAAGISRSELIQEASAHYIAHTADERTSEQRRREVEGAIEGIRAMSAKYPLRDPRPSLEILREIRAFDGGGPALDSPEREAWEREVGYAEWKRRTEAEDAGL